MLKLKCHHCGYTADNIPDKYAGKTVKCPKCKGGGVKIPEIELELDESAVESVPEPTDKSAASAVKIAENTDQNASHPKRDTNVPSTKRLQTKRIVTWAVAASVIIFGFAYGMTSDRFKDVFFRTLQGRLGDDTEDYQKRIRAETRMAAELKDKTIRDQEIAKTEKEIEDLKKKRDSHRTPPPEEKVDQETLDYYKWKAQQTHEQSDDEDDYYVESLEGVPGMPLTNEGLAQFRLMLSANSDKLLPFLSKLQRKEGASLQDRIQIVKIYKDMFNKKGWSYEVSLFNFIDAFRKNEKIIESEIASPFRVALQACIIDSTQDCNILQPHIHKYFGKEAVDALIEKGYLKKEGIRQVARSAQTQDSAYLSQIRPEDGLPMSQKGLKYWKSIVDGNIDSISPLVRSIKEKPNNAERVELIGVYDGILQKGRLSYEASLFNFINAYKKDKNIIKSEIATPFILAFQVCADDKTPDCKALHQYIDKSVGKFVVKTVSEDNGLASLVGKMSDDEDDDEMPGLGESEVMPLTAESAAIINELIEANIRQYNNIFNDIKNEKTKTGDIGAHNFVILTNFFIKLFAKKNWNYEASLGMYIKAYENKDLKTIGICEKIQIAKFFLPAFQACSRDNTPDCKSLEKSIRPYYRRQVLHAIESGVFDSVASSFTAAQTSPSKPQKPAMPLTKVSLKKLQDYARQSKNKDRITICYKNKLLKGYATIQDKVCVVKIYKEFLSENGWDYDLSIIQYFNLFLNKPDTFENLDTPFDVVIEICNEDKSADREACSSLKGVLSDEALQKAVGFSNAG